MAKVQKNPSKASVSSGSVKGNAGPGEERAKVDKQNSQNNQFKRG